MSRTDSLMDLILSIVSICRGAVLISARIQGLIIIELDNILMHGELYQI